MDPALAITAAGLTLAVVGDLKRRKIPNSLNFSMMLAGLVLHAVQGEFAAPWLGMLTAFGLYYPLWRFGAFAGGDAKLMMGVGALMGWRFVFEASAWAMIAFVPVALVTLAMLGKLGAFTEAAKWSLQKARGQPVGERPPATKMAFGPVLAAGCVIAAATNIIVI